MQTVPEPTETSNSPSQLDLYREWIEHAPTDPGPSAPGLVGFTDGLGYYLCITCAGRIMARGCALQSPAAPVWDNSDDCCDLCGRTA